MKKILALVLGGVLVMGALAGCGRGKSEADDLIGRWRATVDFSDALNAHTAANGLGEFATVSGFALTLELELKDDGTYALDAAADLAPVREQMKAGIEAYFQPMLEGQDLTVDGALAGAGTSVEAMLDQALGQQALDALTAPFKAQGQYEAREGKLYWSAAPNQTPEGEGQSYTREGDALTLDPGGSALGDLASFLPLTFTRAE